MANKTGSREFAQDCLVVKLCNGSVYVGCARPARNRKIVIINREIVQSSNRKIVKLSNRQIRAALP